MIDIFAPIFAKIRSLCQQQLDHAAKEEKGTKVKCLFLVGGFGSNNYLFKYLEQQLGSSVRLLQPEGG